MTFDKRWHSQDQHKKKIESRRKNPIYYVDLGITGSDLFLKQNKNYGLSHPWHTRSSHIKDNTDLHQTIGKLQASTVLCLQGPINKYSYIIFRGTYSGHVIRFSYFSWTVDSIQVSKFSKLTEQTKCTCKGHLSNENSGIQDNEMAVVCNYRLTYTSLLPSNLD